MSLKLINRVYLVSCYGALGRDEYFRCTDGISANTPRGRREGGREGGRKGGRGEGRRLSLPTEPSVVTGLFVKVYYLNRTSLDRHSQSRFGLPPVDISRVINKSVQTRIIKSTERSTNIYNRHRNLKKYINLKLCFI